MGYSAVLSVAAAMHKAKSTDAEKLVAAMKGLNLDTPFGKISYRALLYKIVVLHNQDFANVIGVIQKQNMVPTDLVMRDVAVFLRQVLKENNGISRAKAAESEPKQVSLKTPRKSVRPFTAIPTHLVLNCACHYNQFKRSIGFSGTRRTQGRRVFLFATNLIALVKPEMTLANGGL